MAIVLSYYGNRESDAALDQAVRLASWMRTSLMIVVASHECGGIFADENSAEAHLWERLDGTEVSFVIGLRPGGSKNATIGNTATQILLDAPCPVMTSSWRFEDVNA